MSRAIGGWPRFPSTAGRTYDVGGPVDHLVEWLAAAHDDGRPALHVFAMRSPVLPGTWRVNVVRQDGSALSETEAAEVEALLRAHVAERFTRGPGGGGGR